LFGCNVWFALLQVGVVGDPGSGKYSLVGALLRLGQVQGMLFMDGYDVLKIGLYELRRNIAVIPKASDPFLANICLFLPSLSFISSKYCCVA
jgi:ABC-type multidrug transport system fused ATPase/permease subunit